MKRSFFQAVVASILLYGCTTWTLTKRLEKKLDGNYTRMLRAILNKSWRQHPTRHQLYGHLPPISKTIQVRRTRHVGHCWRSREELISDVLLWIPTYGRAKAGWPARTYIQQLCEDTGCSPEDLPEAMNDREKWRERVRDICATSTTWWWWWYRGCTIHKRRQHCCWLPRSTCSVNIDPCDPPTISESQKKNDEIDKYKSQLNPYERQESSILCNQTTSTSRSYIPETLRWRIFEMFHISLLGPIPTMKLIKARYFWPDIERNIQPWVNGCLQYQQHKISWHTRT